MVQAATLSIRPDNDRSFAILRDALWAGEIGQREFETRSADLGVEAHKIAGTVYELRVEDGVAF